MAEAMQNTSALFMGLLQQLKRLRKEVETVMAELGGQADIEPQREAAARGGLAAS